MERCVRRRSNDIDFNLQTPRLDGVGRNVNVARDSPGFLVAVRVRCRIIDCHRASDTFVESREPARREVKVTYVGRMATRVRRVNHDDLSRPLNARAGYFGTGVSRLGKKKKKTGKRKKNRARACCASYFSNAPPPPLEPTVVTESRSAASERATRRRIRLCKSPACS